MPPHQGPFTDEPTAPNPILGGREPLRRGLRRIDRPSRQQRRRITGLDIEYTSDITWIEDCSEVDEDRAAELESGYEATGEEPEGCTRTGYIDEWEYVTCCLTKEAADAYIWRNGHNLCEPRVYVDSAYRNEEWIKLRTYLSGRPS